MSKSSNLPATPVKQQSPPPPGSITKKSTISTKQQQSRGPHATSSTSASVALAGIPLHQVDITTSTNGGGGHHHHRHHSPPPPTTTPHNVANMSPSSSATAEWVMSQGPVMVAVDASVTALDAVSSKQNAAVSSSSGAGMTGASTLPDIVSRHASFDLATLAGANTEVYFDAVEEAVSHSPLASHDGSNSRERPYDAAGGAAAAMESMTPDGGGGARGLDVKRKHLSFSGAGATTVKSPSSQGPPVGTVLQCREEEEGSTQSGSAAGDVEAEGTSGVGGGAVLHTEVETLSFACSEEIDLASSANNRRKFVQMQRKHQEAKRAAQLSREAVQYISTTAAGKSISKTIDEEMVNPLIPNPTMLIHRHNILEHVCFHVTQALRFTGINAHIAFFVFGSVHLRTVLPDGDIDVTMVLMDPAKDGTCGYSIHDATLPHHNFADAASDGNNLTPSAPLTSPTTQATGYSPAADVLPSVRDYLLSMPTTGIFVDSLVFAEVRVLKLMADGLSMDFTVDQTGGTSTVCFLHQVDRRLGHRHLFKRTLLLLKAWANYEARVLSGQGGYLGTYALTIMLMGVMNAVLSEHSYQQHSKQSATDETSASSKTKRERTKRKPLPAVELTELCPLSLALRFFAYYATFDFETNCATIYGAMPISALQRASDGIAATSAASTVTCDLSECEERTGGSTHCCGGSSTGHDAVTWHQDSNELLISETFVAECAAMFGRGSADPAATTTPSASPLVTPESQAAINAFPSLSGTTTTTAADQKRKQRGDGESTASSHSTDKPQSCSSRYHPRSAYLPQFSAHLLSLAGGGVFPVRSMNIMDPLRPSSNLSRGVSRAHVFRIQAAMLHALHKGSGLLQSLAHVLVSEPSAPSASSSTSQSTSALGRPIGTNPALLAAEEAIIRSQFVAQWFPSTVNIIAAFQLRQLTEPSYLANSMQELSEQIFGGVSKCNECGVPSTLCVTETYLRKPELVAIPPVSIPEHQHHSQQQQQQQQQFQHHHQQQPSTHYHHHHNNNSSSSNHAMSKHHSTSHTGDATHHSYSSSYHHHQGGSSQQQQHHGKFASTSASSSSQQTHHHSRSTSNSNNYQQQQQQPTAWDLPPVHQYSSNNSQSSFHTGAHHHHHHQYSGPSHRHHHIASTPSSKLWPGRMEDAQQQQQQPLPSTEATGYSRPSLPTTTTAAAASNTTSAAVPTYRFPSHLQGLPQRGGGGGGSSGSNWASHSSGQQLTASHRSAGGGGAATASWNSSLPYQTPPAGGAGNDAIPPPPPLPHHHHHHHHDPNGTVPPPMFASALAFQTHMNAHHQHHHHHHHHVPLSSAAATVSSSSEASAAAVARSGGEQRAQASTTSSNAQAIEVIDRLTTSPAEHVKTKQPLQPSSGRATTAATAKPAREKGTTRSGGNRATRGRAHDETHSTASGGGRHSSITIPLPPPLNSDRFPALPS
ncbi:Hypothetical protein, putative [Bodo saltans]|uniref:PAP/OAS1 substrate-binding-related domain-containing protein n=1 Tax=Bodo saltans TaxID=75058 RepID=A0A0S4JMF1_BODSA|nr:Hypothetical protein, putative [Bodo saltans]|eukprot:CUG91821.1 Hypothetical protein, putative [Bodo saltans]